MLCASTQHSAAAIWRSSAAVGRLGSFFTQAESMDVTAARLSGTRQFTGRGRGQVGQLLHASKTGMLQTEFLSAPGKEQRRAADGARHHGAAPGSNYRRPKAVRGKKNLGRDLCAATTAQLRRGVPRLVR